MCGERSSDAIEVLACASRRDDVTRRRFVGQMSAAALAALVGAELAAGQAEAIPVVDVTGIQAAPERAYPLPASDGVAIDREEQLIVVRFQQKAYAFSLACPHENTALRWRDRDARFQCPRHQSKYQPDGTFISGRATRNMDRFAIRREGDRLLVDLARLYRSDRHPAEWAAAVATL